MASRGAFIVFEGIDRCGKTTQSLRLVENLNQRGKPAKHMRFPGTKVHCRSGANLFKIGRQKQARLWMLTCVVPLTLRTTLFTCCFLQTDGKPGIKLFNAYLLCRDAMRKSLGEGTTLITDRYAYSGAAYTASKGYDLQWCKNPDVGLPRPDLVIFLDISVENAMKRGEFGQERYEKKDVQEKVRDLFHLMKEDNWKVQEQL